MNQGDNRRLEGAIFELRRVLAENLDRAMTETPGLETSRALGPKAGVSYKTIDRMLEPKLDGSPPTLENICRVAAALDISVWQLLRKRPLIEGQEGRIEKSPEEEVNKRKGTAIKV